MRNIKIAIGLFFTILILQSACTTKVNTNVDEYVYTPDDQHLHDTIAFLDSLFFSYYNTCDVNLDKLSALISDSVEFYHDKGGITTVKQDLIDAIKKNICGKVRREAVKGSIEVYPISGYGAFEMGLHKFHNSAEPGAPSRPGRYTMIWQQKNNEWKITRVVSLH